MECGASRQGGNCNVHYGTTNTQTGPHHFDGDLTQWHVYGCELHDTGVRYYLDGKVVKELTGPNVTSQHIHRLGIQLDVGRSNRVSGDVRLFADWVRVSKFAGA